MQDPIAAPHVTGKHLTSLQATFYNAVITEQLPTKLAFMA